MKRIGIRVTVAALMVAGLAMLAGCPDELKPRVATRQEELTARIKGYFGCFYNFEFERASLFVAPEKRAEFMVFAEKHSQGYTQENFSIRSIQINSPGDQAQVVARRFYSRWPAGALQSEKLKQTWVRLDKVWYLSGPPF